MLEHRYIDIISGRQKGTAYALVRGALSCAELPYRAAMRARNAHYDRNPSRCLPLGRPTLSIGNITAGGTGKTPVVYHLACKLAVLGYRPAVLMRGYRKSSSDCSDEQVLLQNLLPGLIVEANPDRIAGAQAVLAREPGVTCFLLDDGFQHRRARRDFDLVLIHAAEPFGFGHVHPRGLLREPLQGLARASAILLTHACTPKPQTLLSTQQTIRQYTSAPMFHCDHVNTSLFGPDGLRAEFSDLALIPFILATGIGNPAAMLASLGRFTSFKGQRLYDDHHHYTREDLLGLAAQARELGARAIVTSEKDWTKIAPLYPHVRAELPPLYRLQVAIRFWENEEAPLLALIASAFAKRQ